MNQTAVILVNLGTPLAPKKCAIRTFLRRFLSDKRVVNLPRLLWLPILYLFILPFRPKNLVHQYQSIWRNDFSPLEVYMRDIAGQLKYVYAMTYSAPLLPDVLNDCLSRKIDNLIILPLYPQYSNSTTGAVFDQVFKTLLAKDNLPSLKIINNYHNHPAYIAALAESVKIFWQQHAKPQKLIMSFHGIPQRSVDEGDPYDFQCKTTAQLLANALELQEHEWQLVYQSRFGKAKWLQPYCDKTLELLPSQSVTDIHIICPGFSVDCLETLEEISHTNKQLFLNAGGKSYAYIPALNGTDAQCRLITALVKEVAA